MHKKFRKLLEDTRGISEFIIAINLDIRDFSSFSKKVESPEVAIFIKRVYMKLIDEYFPRASFFKPTGDGLFITIPYTEKELEEIVRNTINYCFKVLKDFSAFCINDPMINFDVPTKIGIGISRGTACRLMAGKTTLDYSGKVLNLASRLMDLARPGGIVFDVDFGIELLSDNQIKNFEKDSVYIKGIAEREPINIYYTKGLTRISPLSRQPIDETRWKRIVKTKTLKQIKESRRFIFDLPSEPMDSNDIKVKITHAKVVRGKVRKGLIVIFDFDKFDYNMEAGKSYIAIEFSTLAERLEAYGVKNKWEVKIEIIYPEK